MGSDDKEERENNEREVPPSEVWKEMRPEHRARVIHLLTSIAIKYISSRTGPPSAVDHGKEGTVENEDQSEHLDPKTK